jgi:hypothetical protein
VEAFAAGAAEDLPVPNPYDPPKVEQRPRSTFLSVLVIAAWIIAHLAFWFVGVPLVQSLGD